MRPPVPDRDLLAREILYACGRGLPVQVAEDLVFEAVERASARFDPSRGTFASLLRTAVRNACAGWWRTQAVAERAHDGLAEVSRTFEPERTRRAERNQALLLEALDADERRIFHAWALQKHLGKSRASSETVGASLGMDASTYENAKRRLKARLQRLLQERG